MARGKADIANTAIRMFLQDIGTAYDKQRGLKPFSGGVKGKDFETVIKFFGGRCCYCNSRFDASVKPSQDHLIPINRTDLGLHAWGNIVAACRECNASKHGGDWRTFIIERTASGPDGKDRLNRMQEFLSEFAYNPKFELEETASELYEEISAISTALIDLKVNRVRGSM